MRNKAYRTLEQNLTQLRRVITQVARSAEQEMLQNGSENLEMAKNILFVKIEPTLNNFRSHLQF